MTTHPGGSRRVPEKVVHFTTGKSPAIAFSELIAISGAVMVFDVRR